MPLQDATRLRWLAEEFRGQRQSCQQIFCVYSPKCKDFISSQLVGTVSSRSIVVLGFNLGGGGELGQSLLQSKSPRAEDPRLVPIDPARLLLWSNARQPHEANFCPIIWRHASQFIPPIQHGFSIQSRLIGWYFGDVGGLVASVYHNQLFGLTPPHILQQDPCCY